MSQNQEIIESKLCAYVDGELDAEGRAEIEKHLNANPQHRRLLESLRATRDLLRWLPREPAPPELAETLNGQLERSVLLDYQGDGMRIPIWPRVFAAAAIIALTVGLAAAVFYALPRSQKPALAIGNSSHNETESGAGNNDNRHFSFKPSETPATSPLDESTEDRPGARTLAEGAGRGKVEEAAKEMASKDGSPAEVRKGGFSDVDFADRDHAKKVDESVAMASSLRSDKQLGVANIDQLADQVAQNPGVLASSSSIDGNAGTQPTVQPTGNNAMVMLVRSDAPEQTEKQLTSFFKSQQIQWRQTQLPAQNLELNNAPPAAADKESQLFLGNNQSQATANGEQQKSQVALNDAMKEAPGRAYAGKGGSVEDARSESQTDYRRQGINRAADTQPSQKDAMAKGNLSGPSAAASEYNLLSQGQAQNFNGGQGAQQSPALDNAANNSRSNGVYVVQMSRRQAQQLCTTISNDRSQAAQTRDVSALAYSNSNSDPTMLRNAPKPGQQFGAARRGGDAPQLGEPTTNPAPADATRERLSKAAPAPVVVDSKLKQSTNEKASQDKSPTTPPGKVVTGDHPYLGVTATTGGTLSPAPVPATQGSGAALAPLTQPSDAAAGPTTMPADEAVSVVILVEGNRSPAAAAAPVPATQPANQIEQSQTPAAPASPAQNAK